MAEVAANGAEKCAGLEVKRYTLKSLTDCLGPGFDVIEHFEQIYTNPNGAPRPYLYALYKRIN